MQNIPFKNNIVFRKDHINELLVDAYRILWQKNSQTILKLNALSLIAKYLEKDEVKDRLEYLLVKENNRRIRRVMQSILDGTFNQNSEL